MNSDSLAARIEKVLAPTPPSSPENIQSRPPPPVPNHEIIARIGGGSYGEVWLAKSVTGALRAVKVVWRSHFSSERPYEREFRGIVQFEPISRSHPGVVNVLHVGRDDAAGCFFYVMELADSVISNQCSVISKSPPRSAAADSSNTGSPMTDSLITDYSPRTLASELKSRTRLPVTDAVSLGVQLAGALGHLHRHGLVHRDVKPSNVIFVNGQPKLADIGLVTGVNEERSFVGTEGFIPPEGPGSERADLFALGRLLYEAATGKNRCDFPGLPDDLDRWPKTEREALIELNEVLARACAPEPKKRHSNAAELAGDLNLILAGRSVRRAYGVERRLRRATLISAAALVLVLVAVFSNWLQRRQRELSDARARRETTLRQRAEAAERESEQQLYTALLEQARATVLTGERGQRIRALEAVRRAGAISNSVALRGVAVAALSLRDLRFERELPVPSGVTLAKLDPAFERIALCSSNSPVEIRSVADRRLLAILPASTNKPAYVGVWSPGGRHFALCRDHDSQGHMKTVEAWDVAGSNRVLLLRNSPRGAMSFHPRLPQIMVGCPGDAAVIYDLATGQELIRHQLAGQLVELKFSPDGERFAATYGVGSNWTVVVHSTTTGLAIADHLFDAPVQECNWHPGGRRLGVADYSGAVHWMDAETGETRLVGQHKASAAHAVFSPDGKYLFSGGWDRELICWDAKTLRRAFTVGLDSYRIQFRADGRQCATVHWGNAQTIVHLQLHTLESPTLCREFAGDIGGGRNSAAFSPDGRWLVASGAERLMVWNSTGDEAGAEISVRFTAMSVRFAPNGDLFAFRPGECSRWRMNAGTNGAAPALEPLALFQPAGFQSLFPTLDGVVFTTARGSKLVGYDQLSAGQAVLGGSMAEGGDGWKPVPIGPIGVSPDGRWLSVYRDFTAYSYIYRLPEFERVAKFTNQARAGQLQFSPLGDEVAIPGRAGIEFRSTTTWQRTRHLTNGTDILYSPDARTFWLWTGYRTAGLYDARTAELLLPLPPGTTPLALSPDGQRLAASVDARRVQVWDLAEVRGRLRELGLDWAESQ